MFAAEVNQCVIFIIIQIILITFLYSTWDVNLLWSALINPRWSGAIASLPEDIHNASFALSNFQITLNVALVWAFLNGNVNWDAVVLGLGGCNLAHPIHLPVFLILISIGGDSIQILTVGSYLIELVQV